MICEIKGMKFDVISRYLVVRWAWGQSTDSESSSQGIQRFWFVGKSWLMFQEKHRQAAPGRRTWEDQEPLQWPSGHSRRWSGRAEGTTRPEILEDISWKVERNRGITHIWPWVELNQPVKREPLVDKNPGEELVGAAISSTSASIASGHVEHTWIFLVFKNLGFITGPVHKHPQGALLCTQVELLWLLKATKVPPTWNRMKSEKFLAISFHPVGSTTVSR